MAKPSKIIFSCLVSSHLLILPIFCLADPSTEELLKASLGPGRQSYQGRMTVTYWSDKATHSEEFEILFVPPNRYRMEYYKPDGRVSRIVWRNGDQERVEFPNGKKVYLGKAIKSSSKLMVPSEEWKLLLTNYSVTKNGSESVAGHPTWILHLIPRTRGKPNQTLWVDKKNEMVLKVKRFQPRTNYAVLSQFTQIETDPVIDATLFDIKASTTRVVTLNGLDPHFLSLENLRGDTDLRPEPPRSLKNGFVFESGDVFTVKGKGVRHFRYTDGLTVLSLFETKRPVQLHERRPPVSEIAEPSEPGVFHTPGPIGVVHWKSRGFHYTLMGDLSQQALQEISTSIK